MTADETIRTLCVRRPLALAVLGELEIAITGAATLEACCAASGVTTSVVESAIAAAEAELATRWSECSTPPKTASLLDEVMRAFHRPLSAEVGAVRRACDAAWTSTLDAGWRSLVAELDELEADLAQHIEMEERVVFPWLRDYAPSAIATIRALMLEHGDAIEHLLEIELRARACIAEKPDDTPGREAISALHRLERWLCEHIHIESNVLFPRVLHEEITRR